MKICFYTENYYKGGLDTFLINLFNAWPSPEDELILVCNKSHPGLETIVEKTNRKLVVKKYVSFFTSKFSQGQSSFKISRSIPFRLFFVISQRILHYPVLFPWYIMSLALYFRKNKFDRLMVVNGGYPASLLCQCASIAWRIVNRDNKAIFNFHNLTSNPPWFCRFPEFLIDRAVINSSSKIVSVSKACLNTLNSRKAFRKCINLEFIHNGITPPIIDACEKNYEPVNEKKPYCLMLATYEARKGHSYLLRAFKEVIKDFPEIQLEIYGYGKKHEKERVAAEVFAYSLQNNVSLNEFTAQPYRLIANASILVVPSQEYESFGLTIIEAMALGVPVVTTDIGGIPEVIDGTHAGYVCSKNNSGEFADAIRKILGNPELARQLGRNGKNVFQERYTASHMARQYESLIKTNQKFFS